MAPNPAACSMVRIAALLLLLSMLFLSPVASAETYKVYRCTSDTGAVEFRHVPCTTGAETELRIEDRKVGWDAPAVDSGTKPKKKKHSKPREVARSTKPVSEEKCWKKEEQLEKVNWQLRRGYKAGKGVKLQRRRREYEEYLSRFCK